MKAKSGPGVHVELFDGRIEEFFKEIDADNDGYAYQEEIEEWNKRKDKKQKKPHHEEL